MAVAIAVYALLKMNQKESVISQETSEVTMQSENMNEPQAIEEPQPINEPVQDSSEDPFQHGLDSPETGEFIKNLIKDYFYIEAMNKSNKKVREPFGSKLINVPNTMIDYHTAVYNPEARTEEFYEVQKNILYFDHNTISSIIDNFQLVNCEKGVTRSSKIAYDCAFILSDLVNTGLNEVENRGPWNFRVLVVQQDSGYEVTSIE